jgi:hypothetical protein
MGKAKTAKTASKNNPVARQKAKEMFFNGKKIKPVRFISSGTSYIAAQYEDGNLVVDRAGKPLPWKKIKK